MFEGGGYYSRALLFGGKLEGREGAVGTIDRYFSPYGDGDLNEGFDNGGEEIAYWSASFAFLPDKGIER